MKIENMFNNEKGTSPVIGVMLMVVVTVILAAAVSSYSSGMIDTTESAPVATFDVKCVKDVDDGWGTMMSYLQIKQITGESMSTADLKIMTTDANGVITEVLPGNAGADYTDAWATPYTGSAPYLANPGVGYFGSSPLVDFGNYTLKTGSCMDASKYATDTGNTSLDVMFSDWANVTDGDFVNIKIVHTPSQKVIFQTDTEVI